MVEGFHLAALQHVAVGEDDAVVVRQQHAGVADGIQPMHGAGFLVEDQIAVQGLAVRQDLQQDQRSDAGVENLRVVQCLVAVRNGLGVDPAAVLGVVLDLDGEVAADGFHKHAVLDRDMRMQTRPVHSAMGADPLELVLFWIDILMIEAVAEVFEPPARHAPLEDLDVLQRLARPHRKIEMRTDDHELLEDRLAVILEEVREVRGEAGVVQHLENRHRGEGARFRIVVVGGKHIADVRRLLQPELDVVTEEKAALADRHQIAGDAVVLGGHALGAEQRGLHTAEHGQALGVQFVQSLAQRARMLVQPGADHLIRATFEPVLGWLVGFRHG